MLSRDGTNLLDRSWALGAEDHTAAVPGFRATVSERCPCCSILPFNNPPPSLKVHCCTNEGAHHGAAILSAEHAEISGSALMEFGNPFLYSLTLNGIQVIDRHVFKVSRGQACSMQTRSRLGRRHSTVHPTSPDVRSFPLSCGQPWQTINTLSLTTHTGESSFIEQFPLIVQYA